MFLTPFDHLTWAYQLHYHICFRTHRRRDFFAEERIRTALEAVANDNCYHILEIKVRPNDVQLVLSLRPEHRISDVLKKLKGRSSATLCSQLKITAPLWAVGYLARSTGKVRVQAIKHYLDRQAAHHGYEKRVLPPVFRFRNGNPAVLNVAHASFNLQHHLVLATQYRQGVFDSRLGEALVSYGTRLRWHEISSWIRQRCYRITYMRWSA